METKQTITRFADDGMPESFDVQVTYTSAVADKPLTVAEKLNVALAHHHEVEAHTASRRAKLMQMKLNIVLAMCYALGIEPAEATAELDKTFNADTPAIQKFMATGDPSDMIAVLTAPEIEWLNAKIDGIPLHSLIGMLLSGKL